LLLLLFRGLSQNLSGVSTIHCFTLTYAVFKELQKRKSLSRNSRFKIHFFALVGLTGLEPVTLRLSSACSNQLSYRPIVVFQGFHLKHLVSENLEDWVTADFEPTMSDSMMVELGRFELPTYSLQSYRSTN
jgi:hypothetical protein